MINAKVPFFSIVSPIYNVKRFVRRGVDIVLSQSYADFELILVDDGSSDGSGELCDECARRWPRVRVVHQANAGAGPARNAGIETARGEYVMFFDIDDSLRPGALELLHREIVARRPDLLMFGYRETDASTGVWHDFRFEPAVFETNEAMKKKWGWEMSGAKFSNGFVWNKVYRRAFLEENHLKFEALRIQQDEVFNLAVYPKAERTVAIGDILYDYYVYESGNTRSHFIGERYEIYRRVREAFLEVLSGWGVETPGLRAYVENRFLMSVSESIDFNLYHPENTMSRRERREALEQILSSPELKESLGWLRQNGRWPQSVVKRLYYESMERGQTWLYTVARLLNKYGKATKKWARGCLRHARP